MCVIKLLRDADCMGSKFNPILAIMLRDNGAVPTYIYVLFVNRTFSGTVVWIYLCLAPQHCREVVVSWH